MKNLFRSFSVLLATVFIFSSCEGPRGLAGLDGKDGADGKDANSNPAGYWRNPAHGTPAFPTLTNAQFGAIINFQLVVRDGSLGIHNYPYIMTLLENTIDAI